MAKRRYFIISYSAACVNKKIVLKRTEHIYLPSLSAENKATFYSIDVYWRLFQIIARRQRAGSTNWSGEKMRPKCHPISVSLFFSSCVVWRALLIVVNDERAAVAATKIVCLTST
jgi:hypothetical protein